MEKEKYKSPRIPLYKKRSLGEKITATFEFLKENWRVWLSCVTYLLLPLCLFQALAQNILTSTFMNVSILENANDDSPFITMVLAYGVQTLFVITGSILLSSLIYAMLRYYRENDHRLTGVTLRDLKSLILHNIKRMLIVTLLGIALTIVVIAIIVLLIDHPILLLLILIAMIALLIPMMLILPVYVFEDDTTVFGAVSRGFTLGLNTWGGTFMVALVTGILAYILQIVTSIPWYIAFMVKTIFFVSDSSNTFFDSGIYNFLLYLFGVLQAFGTYIASSFTVTGIAYQYGSAAEEQDAISVDADIQNFERMTDNDELSDFENL